MFAFHIPPGITGSFITVVGVMNDATRTGVEVVGWLVDVPAVRTGDSNSSPVAAGVGLVLLPDRSR
jgi:hypothetical protein